MINKEMAQRNFDLACKAYENAKETIRELTTYVKMALPNFSFEIAMKQFDLILQGVLLRTATEDGYFLDEERQFIEKITDYGDIMAHFNKKGISISWDTFDNISNEDQKELSLKMVVALKELADDFVTPFALVDAIFPKDYCEILTKQMGMICITLAQCDGDATESSDFKSEGLVAVALINKIIKEKWNEVEAQSNKSSVQSKSQISSRSNTLKENFLKKKTLM